MMSIDTDGFTDHRLSSSLVSPIRQPATVDVNHLGDDLDLAFSTEFEIRREKLEELQARIRAAPIATQAALDAFTPVADEYQQRVIAARDHTIRLLAPAGSGKTQTMINRVLSRVKDGVAPERILMLTFDRSAAGSLTDKLRSSLGELTPANGQAAAVARLPISTLNAFGYRLLRELAPDEYRSLVTAHMQVKLVKQALKMLEEKSLERYQCLPAHLRYRYYLDFFSFLKNQIHDPRRPNGQAIADLILTARQAGAFFEEEPDAATAQRIVQAVIWLFSMYDRLLARQQLIDFDDQKLRIYIVLKDDDALQRRVQKRFTEVVVDEFQDINKLDFEFIKLLAKEADLVVTGDDDQAIYGFRGCSPDYIIDLPQHFDRRPVDSYELSINYRCPPNIVAHADRLIRQNARRIEKHPIPHSSKPSTINVAATLSASLEAKSITEFIKQMLYRDRSLGHKDIAVLYRTNAQSLPIQIEFILDNIPYIVRDEDNIVSNEALERLLAVLRLKVAHDRKAIMRAADQLLAIRAYFRFVDGATRDSLRGAIADGPVFLGPRATAAFYQAMPKARESVLFAAMEEVFAAVTLDEALDVLRRRFKGLQGMVGSLEDAVEQRVPLAEIFDVAKDFKGNTGEFVETMDRALARAKEVNAGHAEQGVSLLTYFKSKGRQWHTVILTSCNEGLIPHAKAPVEEERRLFYVALTRPSSNLLVSYVQNACDNKVRPSRFLYEAGLLT